MQQQQQQKGNSKPLPVTRLCPVWSHTTAPPSNGAELLPPSWPLWQLTRKLGGKTHLHQHLKKNTYRFESEKNGKEKEKRDFIMESSDVFRAINPLRKNKGQNAEEKADTTCLKPTCMLALDVVWSGSICCRFVHAR